MQPYPDLAELAAEASEANVEWSAVLQRAGIASTTEWRWRKGTFHPRYATILKLREALAAEIAGADRDNESHPPRVPKPHSPKRRAHARQGVE